MIFLAKFFFIIKAGGLKEVATVSKMEIVQYVGLLDKT
jgi:hypothetical protein